MPNTTQLVTEHLNWTGPATQAGLPSSFPPVNGKKCQAEGISLVKFNFSFAGVLPIEACF